VSEGRSAETWRAGQQRYAVVEFCDDPETLWGKLESRRWDWLGVRERPGRKTFVVGRPRQSRGFEIRVTATVRNPGEPIYDDTFRVTTQEPADDRVSSTKHGSAKAAWAAFRARVAELQAPTGDSGLCRVRLYIDGSLADEALVVRALPNIL
jgi:hypothetical protein